MATDPYRQSIIDYFEQRYNNFGDSPQAVDYSGRQAQYQRFEVLAALAQLGGKQLLDVGCGLGHFYDFLHEHGITPRGYHGIDIVPDFIKGAQQRWPTLDFSVKDLLTADLPSQPPYDYVICCGLFHQQGLYSAAEWQQFSETMITRMFAYARYGLAFNLNSDNCDQPLQNTYYADPCYYFDFCRKNLSPRISLRHDYPLSEFTIYLFREHQRA